MLRTTREAKRQRGLLVALDQFTELFVGFHTYEGFLVFARFEQHHCRNTADAQFLSHGFMGIKVKLEDGDRVPIVIG